MVEEVRDQDREAEESDSKILKENCFSQIQFFLKIYKIDVFVFNES